MPDPTLDDIDRLFAACDAVEPPTELYARIIQESRAATTERRTGSDRILPAIYGTVYIAAMLGLSVLGYQLGLALARNGSSMLAGTLLSDLSLLSDAPAAYLGALSASIPWLHLAAVALDLVILCFTTALLVRGHGTGDSHLRTRTGAGA